MIRILKKILSPIVMDGLRFLKNRNYKGYPEWEYMPLGWRTAQTDSNIKGWNVPGVLESYKSQWPSFLKALEGSMPLDFYPTSVGSAHKGDLVAHNTMMSYAYALMFAARNKTEISMLDWGGALGHYFFFSRAILPDLTIDYHCKDVSLLSEEGKKMLPQAHFYNDESCLLRQYDFVLISGALQYSEDWVSGINRLAAATKGVLFITRIPVLNQASSYVVVQRPYRYKYNTEYLGWCFNRTELIKTVESTELSLVREFFIGDKPVIYHAPEQSESRGFLFQRFPKKVYECDQTADSPENKGSQAFNRNEQ